MLCLPKGFQLLYFMIRGVFVTSGLALLMFASHVQAAQLRWGGFVTVNYAISDIDSSYQRFIDNEGSFKAGTIAGLQADLEITPNLKGAVQLTANARTDADQGTEVKVKWAFLRWHPSADWTLSVGRMRAGIYADAQNLEVGSTYAPVFLPPEIYFNEQYIRYDGLSIQRRFGLSDDADFSLELFAGVNQDNSLRVFSPVTNGSLFFGTEQRTRGLRIAYTKAGLTWFATYLKGNLEDANRPRTFEIDFDIYTTGLQWRFLDGWQVDVDVIHTKSTLAGTSLAGSSDGLGTVVTKRLGSYTPFLSASGTLSSRNAGGDRPSQYTIKGGVAYDYSPSVKLKSELGHVHVGDSSGLIDGPFSNNSFTYLGLSYNLIY